MDAVAPLVPREARQLLDLARQAQGQGALLAAAESCREVIARWPELAEGHHQLALLLFQGGQLEPALACLRLALVLRPACVAWHNDLGNMLSASGRPEEAAAAFIAALALDPQQSLLWNNLGAALLAADRLPDAQLAFEHALALQPTGCDAWLNLATVHTRQGHVLEAAQCQCEAYVLPPHEGKPHQTLAISFYVLHRIEEAAAVYRQWLAVEPGQPIAAHMLAACTVQDVPPRASDAYVEAYFDQAAGEFDNKMVQTLGYQLPVIIGDWLAARHAPAQQLTILDAGCGTGLCGPHLRPFAAELTGVDLSANSLALAQQKQCYDGLYKQELVAYLQAVSPYYDLVVAADTLIYFGELAPCLQAVAQSLKTDGLLLASVEERWDAQPFGILPSGRYNHTQAYVREALAAAGLTLLALQQIVVREELEQPVPGLLFLAQKTDAGRSC